MSSRFVSSSDASLPYNCLINIETLAVHAAADPDPRTGGISPTIHLSTTFEHGPVSEELHGYTYIGDKIRRHYARHRSCWGTSRAASGARGAAVQECGV